MKPKLLYLVHRIPYPPNKGDKIRSYHWLKGLSQKYTVYLGTFIDDENDWQYIEKLKLHCETVHIEKLTPISAKLKSLKGLLTGDPLTRPYYENHTMQQWVSHTVKKEKIKNILVFSSSMAQFVEAENFSGTHRIIDFVDMDSDKWLQYAESKQWPMSWLYRREAKTLFQYEVKIAKKFNRSLFVSSKEAALFSEKLKNKAVSIDHVNNGVNTNYFAPDKSFLNPYKAHEKVIVFTGAMDYWANADAVKWFTDKIFPLVIEQIPKAHFVIVGSKPAKDVIKLQAIPHVTVTGFVDDVRPYIMYADLVVAPMRIARGIQNKVLEAMSMGKTVIVSPQGFEGLNAMLGKELLLSTSIAGWVEQVVNALNSSDDEIGQRARANVMKHYSWDTNTDKLIDAFREPLS